jgi:hypothetical protein
MARPRFNPTKQQRDLVKSLAAYGMKNEGIARLVGLRSVKTLKKCFRTELTLGLYEGLAQVSQTYHQMARSGKYPACTIDYINRRSRYLEMQQETGPRATPAFMVIVEKKAA